MRRVLWPTGDVLLELAQRKLKQAAERAEARGVTFVFEGFFPALCRTIQRFGAPFGNTRLGIYG